MEQSGDRIVITFTDTGVDSLFGTHSVGKGFSQHFSHTEEFFVLLSEEIEIPSFPIHHDVRIKEATERVLVPTREAISRLAAQVPQIFAGTRYFFDSGEILKPAFFQILRIEEQFYAYILKIDLSFRPTSTRVVKAGDNDTTPVYKTDRIFMEADIVPLRDYRQGAKGQLILSVAQTVSETWIGETGRGYFVQGIWLDRELTKFFSKLFLPEGKRLYPYFPYNCKYRAICFQPFDLSDEGRRRAVVSLHRSRLFIERNIREIESAMHKNEFSEQNETYISIRSTVPEYLSQPFKNLSMNAYLNKYDMKEYQLVHGA